MEPCAIKKDSEGYQNDYIDFFFRVDIRELESWIRPSDIFTNLKHVLK